MLSAIAFTIVLLAAIGLFIYQLWGRFNLLLAARGPFKIDFLPERIQAVLVYAFGQKKFIRPAVGIVKERTAGWIHFFVFWGFTILGVQVTTMFARAYFPDFHLFPFVPWLLGKPYAFVRDLFEVTVFVCILALFARWLITRPKRLFGFEPAESRHAHHSHWEAYLILSCIGMITSGGLVYDGGRIVMEHGTEAVASTYWYEPFSYATSRLLLDIGGVDFAEQASNVAWWIHNLAVLVMLNFLPLAKHFHVITSLPNVFFRKMEPLGALSKQDLENATTFGTSHIDQFTWKQVLDMFSCTECGRCSSQCPATATGKPLAPRQLLLNLRDYLYEHQDEMIAKRVNVTPGPDGELPEVGRNLIAPIDDPNHVIADETLWACNTCRACEESCPVMIEYVDKIVDMRRHLVQEESRFPSELTRVFKSMETQSNPWGIGAEKRFDWAEGLDIPTMADNPKAEYLYYVGCAGAFDDRNKKTTQAFARILKKAGVDFACLGPEEPCNGDSARRLGNEYLYQAMAQMCVETFNGYEVKKIIVNCPHCFNTIKNEFPQFDGKYEVVHAAELIQSLVASGRLQLNGGFGDKRTTYHDSCYYGRFNDVYDEPRDILTRAGAKVEEIPHRHHQFGMCCGAGGGRMWIEEDPDKRVNLKRTDQALETNPEVIAVSCPFCMTMLSDGIKAKDLEEKVQTLDVMEIVERALR
jgi:Fe-S oxidoreductase